MLQLLTTDDFAQWFASLDDKTAEDVATALDVVERLGPALAAPGSRESLLWYEHPSLASFQARGSISWELDKWGAFRDYAKRVLEQLESPSFAARMSTVDASDALTVMELIKQIRALTNPRVRWAWKLMQAGTAKADPEDADACARGRHLYLAALAASGFEVVDVPAHSLALRELAHRLPAPGFRLLYGVNVMDETAVFVLGERLDRSFYGDSVRRAERLWQQFLEGRLPSVTERKEL